MTDEGKGALRQAKIVLAQAETERLKAETRKAESDARVAEMAEIVQGIYTREKQRLEKEALAIDKYHYLFRFDDEVDDSSVSRCIDTLTVWHRTNPTAEFEIRLTSPGGSIIDGLALFDYLRELSRAGHKITTSAYGFAASMAGILLQAGDVRAMARESWLMIHEPRLGAVGTMGQVADRMKWIERVNERVIDIFFERSRNGEKPLSRDEIKDKYNRKDWWIPAPDALEYGFIDEIR